MIAGTSAGDFRKAKELIIRGEQAARSTIPEIKMKLEKL